MYEQYNDDLIQYSNGENSNEETNSWNQYIDNEYDLTAEDYCGYNDKREFDHRIKGLRLHQDSDNICSNSEDELSSLGHSMMELLDAEQPMQRVHIVT